MSEKSNLTSMNVSLPKAQKDYIRKQAGDSGCSTPSEYIRRLIHADQEQRAQHRLDELLLEGLNSGPDVEMTPQDWADIRSEVKKKLSSKRKAR